MMQLRVNEMLRQKKRAVMILAGEVLEGFWKNNALSEISALKC